jgi:diaminohydroxyphosphoribosylaminopyrimidine deaminase/5-amino-6-(5-phosphoribosylamino)uracil reductase
VGVNIHSTRQDHHSCGIDDLFRVDRETLPDSGNRLALDQEIRLEGALSGNDETVSDQRFHSNALSLNEETCDNLVILRERQGMSNSMEVEGTRPVFDAKDRRYMRRALTLARKGLGLASPNPAVGCVLVRDGVVAGQGSHVYAGKDHAEVLAVEEAGERARGSTVYVTLEPCSHFGRTPPCTDLLVRAGVRRVVLAATDPNPKVSGRGIEILRSAGIRVDTGLMREDALDLIEPFACLATTGLPLVVSKVGMSLDGRIAAPRGKDLWITSPEGREFGQSLRLQLDAILVGIGTILADDPRLTYRGSRPKARPLIRVVLDSRLRTPLGSQILQSIPQAPVIIFCRGDAPAGRRNRLEARGAEVIPVGQDGSGLDSRSILEELGKRNLPGILVEGGSEVHWSFLSAGLVDKFYFVIAPLVLGGKLAIPAVGGKGYPTVAAAARFWIRRSFGAGPDLILETYPSSSRSILSPWLSSASPPSAGRGFSPSSRLK